MIHKIKQGQGQIEVKGQGHFLKNDRKFAKIM